VVRHVVEGLSVELARELMEVVVEKQGVAG
jgi:hypothetical protein